MMQIFLSRHARRRAQLYNIPESTIVSILEKEIPTLHAGEIIEKVSDYNYPLKIVFVQEDDAITEITVYSLKKGKLVWKFIMIRTLMCSI